ncbi:MAG: xanthine dehydrogenase family protein molybdopterin-binding subunit [Deltaproteobacteria bacterium]|nr:xanthine dehydrogenase family protein molybdopterin-binding subunit [Deltaproteobacteria bacterium]
MAELSLVGRPVSKVDAAEKVTGRTVYIHDLSVPGMLFGKILYADRPSAGIREIDTSEAEKVPGVRAVVTGYNTPEVRFGFLKDNTALKKDRVRQYRDELAAVAATSEEAAAEALAKIRVVYEDLPAVFDPLEALEPEAPLLYERDARGKPLRDNRLRLPWKFESGNVREAEEVSAFVAEGDYETGWVTHCCLGTSGCIASFDTRDNLTIYSNTQIPSLAKSDYQEALTAMGVEGRVRVVNAAIGGGFGSKLDTYAHEYIAILLAHRTRKPVKIVFDREQEFFATSPRQPARIRVRQGCDADGRLTFRAISMVLDNGAHTSWGATTPNVMLLPATSLYRVANVSFEATCVFTNNTYAQAMRGYGNPQVTFAIEANLDELAAKAGIDPLEMRRRNLNLPGETTPQGARITTCGHAECLAAVEKGLGWSGAQEGPREVRGRKARGRGLASMMHVGGGAKIYKSDGCGTFINVDDYGKVQVFTGSMDIGQGLDTILSQIVGETLGIDVGDITVVAGDTDTCPWDAGVHASRSSFVAGNSALGAAKIIREQILAFAEQELEAPRELLELRGGKVFCLEDPSKSMPFAKVVRKAHFSTSGNRMFAAAHYFEPANEPLDKDLRGNNSCAYVWGCHGVEVEVDTETGHVEIVKYVAAHDVGKALNPLLLKGQLYGAVLQGIGFSLSEEMIFDAGRLLNPNFRDYKILTAMDALSVETVIIETNDEQGPFGAKGIGEPGLVPTAPAIANAVYDAVGIRLNKLPMKPEAVLEALLRRRAGEGARTDP